MISKEKAVEEGMRLTRFVKVVYGTITPKNKVAK